MSSSAGGSVGSGASRPSVQQRIVHSQLPAAGRISTTPSMSSTLVETVSIPYEEFFESFLTCSTCLCSYDSADHNPKLLSCSHTVCSSCLERIASLPQSRNTGSFRCPICRETIPVPRGGVVALPPSFLVNQLRDLMETQTRSVVPKCSAHPAEELLFCESCDVVFCPQCIDPVHSDPSGSSDHTVVPFSIAIKRMSEILLYKANHCVKNLNRAVENVSSEMDQLDRNVDSVLDQVNRSFLDLSQQLERRRQEIVDEIRLVRDEKRRILQEQLGIIQTEKAKVEQECSGLEYQVEVRNITRRISELNRKLDVSSTLVEPRENAFLRYDYQPAEILELMQNALRRLGGVEVSKTFPPLCTAVPQPAVCNLACTISLTTIDYHGAPRTTGGDPVDVVVRKIGDSMTSSRTSTLSIAESQEDVGLNRFSFISSPLSGRNRGDTGYSLDLNEEETAKDVPVTVFDRGDGTYELSFKPTDPGRHLLDIRIFGRSIKSSPMFFSVSAHNNPVLTVGGTGANSLVQPVRVQCGRRGEIIMLDTGNSRVKVCTCDGTLMRHIKGDGLEGQSATGLAYSSLTDSFFTLNWRSRLISEWMLDGEERKSFTCSRFVEPIDIAIDECRTRLIVVDNADGGQVFMFDLHSVEFLHSFDLRQSTAKVVPATQQQQQKNEKKISAARHDVCCVGVGLNGDVVVGGTFGVHIYSGEGKFIRKINLSAPLPQSFKGSPPGVQRSNSSPLHRSCHRSGLAQLGGNSTVSGVTVDSEGRVISCATGVQLVDKQKLSASLVVVSGYKGEFLYAIDSYAAKLKRPSGVCLTGADDCHILVADLGNNSVKKFRYK